jgi:hypothetical protein
MCNLPILKFLFDFPTIQTSHDFSKVHTDFNSGASFITRWLNRNFIYWKAEEDMEDYENSKLKRISVISYLYLSIVHYSTPDDNPSSLTVRRFFMNNKKGKFSRVVENTGLTLQEKKDKVNDMAKDIGIFSPRENPE